jgi:2-amino-4-hydroxy-6-hydroxymethyldihydropteridine diphosphokinase
LVDATEQNAILALGANLRFSAMSPAETLAAALEALAVRGLAPLAVSRFYHTPCFPAGAGPDYVNAAALLDAAGRSAPEILAVLHEVEQLYGRERRQRWGMRTLDLDLIALGDTVLPDPQVQTLWRNLPAERQIGATPDVLILPHPRLQDRAFVLVPLADVAPDWRHPLLGFSVSEMLAALPPADREAVRPVVPPPVLEGIGACQGI